MKKAVTLLLALLGGLVLFSGDSREGEFAEVFIDAVEDGLLYGHTD